MLMIAAQLALGADLADQPHDLARRLGVEAGGRLIDEQELRVLLQGAGDADALALAAGERVSPLIRLARSGRRDRAARIALSMSACGKRRVNARQNGT